MEGYAKLEEEFVPATGVTTGIGGSALTLNLPSVPTEDATYYVTLTETDKAESEKSVALTVKKYRPALAGGDVIWTSPETPGITVALATPTTTTGLTFASKGEWDHISINETTGVITREEGWTEDTFTVTVTSDGTGAFASGSQDYNVTVARYQTTLTADLVTWSNASATGVTVDLATPTSRTGLTFTEVGSVDKVEINSTTGVITRSVGYSGGSYTVSIASDGTGMYASTGENPVQATITLGAFRGTTTASLTKKTEGKVNAGTMSAADFKELFTLAVSGSTTTPVWSIKEGDNSYAELGENVTLEPGASYTVSVSIAADTNYAALAP